jgi:hypothetical protein
MADGVTIPAQGTGDTTPKVRTIDRGADGHNQIVALDLNPAGDEQLMEAEEGLPVSIKNLDQTLRQLISLIANPPGRDGLGRMQVFASGGAVNINAGTLTTVSTVSTVSSVTSVAYGGPFGPPAAGSLPMPLLFGLTGPKWADIRDRIS